MSWVCELCNNDFEVQMMGVIGSYKTNDCGEHESFELICINCLKIKFSEIISTLNIPEDKKQDYLWIRDNLGKLNATNHNFTQANFYLKAIINKL